MGIFDFLRGNKVTIELPTPDGKTVKKTISKAEYEKLIASGKIRPLDTVEAHILDPMKGYYTETWVVDEDIGRETAEEFATPSGELFVMYAYENGEPQIMVAKKEVWEKQKSIFASVEQGNDYQEELDGALNDIKNKIENDKS